VSWKGGRDMLKRPEPDVHHNLKELVRKKGKIVKFGELPFACRCAYALYVAQAPLHWETFEDKSWKFPEHLEILKKLPDREGESAWIRGFKNHVRKHLSVVKGHRWVGHLHVPTRMLLPDMGVGGGDYAEFHERCLVNTDYIPQYPQQDIGARWPVILSNETAAPGLLDGYHRFSRYYQLRHHKVPALYFIKQ